MRLKKHFLLPFVLILSLLFSNISFAEVAGQYQNPLMKGADPTVVRGADGFYYSCFGTDDDIYLKKADTVLGISTAKSRMIWDVPYEFGYVWGPYIYRLLDPTDNKYKWYIYFTAGPRTSWGYGHPSSYVIENESIDPFEGEWVLKGEQNYRDEFTPEGEEGVPTPGLLNTESYGLACGVITIAGEQYFTYTKYEYKQDGPVNGSKYGAVSDGDQASGDGTGGDQASGDGTASGGDEASGEGTVSGGNRKRNNGESTEWDTKFNECPTIVKMENPWTLTGTECTVARPEQDKYPWAQEDYGSASPRPIQNGIFEGCALIERGDKVYFAYSASSFMNDNYAVGLSTAATKIDNNTVDEDYILTETNWSVSDKPILKRADENYAFGTGSPLFVKSEDGSEDWLIYHAGPLGGQTSTNRWVRAQRVNWNDDGTINLGIASNPDTILERPSGEIKSEVLEAEDAVYSNVSKSIISDSARSSGSGVMKYDKGSGYVEFTMEAAAEGNYALAFRYNNNTGGGIPMKLTVNEENEQELEFPANGPYAVNLDLQTVYNVRLKAGTNKLRLSSAGANELILDALTLTRTVLYEAEDASDGTVESNHSGFSGSGFVGGLYSVGNAVTFTIEAPYAGNYSVDLRYANGHDTDKKISVYVNGQKIKTSDLFRTDNWDSWADRIDNLELKAGTNTITYQCDAQDEGNVNLDYITVTEAVTRHYEAEYAELSGGAELAADHTGYTGTGFVGGLWQNGAVDFSVYVESAGKYDVKLNYALGFEDSRTVSLYLNGSKVKQVTLGSSGGWDSWKEYLETLELDKGTNMISIRREDGDSGDINIDNLHLNKRTEWKYQAENADNNVGRATDHMWFEGGGFIGGFEEDGNFCEFNVNVPNSGTYKTTLRYCRGHETDTRMSLYINGVDMGDIELPQTGGWDNWAEYTADYMLKSGNNTIKYVRESGEEGGLNLDSLTIDKGADNDSDVQERGIMSGTAYGITSKSCGKSLDVDGYSWDNGRKIQIWPYSQAMCQQWVLMDLGDGYYNILAAHSYKAIDAEDDLYLYQQESNGEDESQQWRLEREGDYYKLVNRKYEKVLSIENNETFDGARVQLRDYEGGDSQLWAIHTPGALFADPGSDHTEHTFINWVSNGDGTHTGTCECGEAKTDNCDNMSGNCAAPTACSVCGQEYGRDNHTGPTEVRDQKDATCTDKGYTGDTYCVSCGVKLNSGEETAALQHQWDEGKITIEATVDQEGEKVYTCGECKQTKTEKLGKLPASEYEITEGAGSVWEKESGKALRIVCKGDFSKFTGLRVNGRMISGKEYTAASEKGNTVITLKADYLESLKAGDYTLDMLYEAGTVKTAFTVKDKTQSPDPEPDDKPDPEPDDKPDAEPDDKPDPEPDDKPDTAPENNSSQDKSGNESAAGENKTVQMTYVVRKGDNLYKIAARNGMSLQELLARNPQITNPNRIYVGQYINIGKILTGSDEVYYTVIKGDSLSKIARKYQMTLKELKSLNPEIFTQKYIYVSQRIRVK